MNKKKCYATLVLFLKQLESTYCLNNGAYRLNFYSKLDNTICYSIITSSKNKIEIDNNIFILFSNRQLISNFDFSVDHFLKTYFEDRLAQFFNLDKSQKIDTLVEVLNDVYIDQAVIPTQLL